MRQADRLLKAIYRESFIRITSNQFEKQDLFNLQDRNFRIKCKTAYLKLYPLNYTGDELDEILNSQSMKLYNLFENSNSAMMFLYYSKKMFNLKNGQVVVSYEHLLEWNGFQNKVDANAFIGAYAASQFNKKLIQNTNIVINHDNERIYKILSNGVCEGHMHLKGSGLTTEISWITFLKSSFQDTDIIDDFINNINNFREFKSYGYTEDEISLSLQKIKLARIILEFNGEINGKLLNDLKKLFYINDFHHFKSAARFQGDTLDNLVYKLKASLDLNKVNSTVSERLFYENIFRRILNKSLNVFQLNLFNFYIWGACIFKFELNQDNVGMGFQKFKHYEEVKDKLIENNDLIYRSVFEKYYEEGVVKKIEFRIAPKSPSEINKLIKKLDEINKEVYDFHVKKKENINSTLSLIKYGLIIHYIKRDDLAQDPNSDKMGRYSKYLLEISNDAYEVEEVLRRQAELTNNPLVHDNVKRKIVAIDAANTEIGCPPEIFALFFRRHRFISDPAGGINFTFHVGEEFKTLESGIRNIDETIDYFEYRRGDRLGHALALGISANRYFKKKRHKIITSLQDYIDNIAWLYGVYSQPKFFNERYVLLITAMYEQYKHYLFKDFIDFPFTISDYIQSMRLRSDNMIHYKNRKEVASTKDMIRKKQFCKNPYEFNQEHLEHETAFLNTNARLLHYHYMYDENFISNGRNTMEYTVNEEWIDLVNDVQIILKEKLINKGIVIEANPSSNLKISSIQHYSELPLLVMNSYKLKDSNKKHVPITINTDDSAIFQTNLSNEYSLIARSLEIEGYQPEKIYSYLEYLRESSCINNFVD